MPSEKSGYEIAMSVDPNVSNDVCTFCKHARWPNSKDDILAPPVCTLGHTSYFRSLSQYGPIYVSDCKSGELRDGFIERKDKPDEG